MSDEPIPRAQASSHDLASLTQRVVDASMHDRSLVQEIHTIYQDDAVAVEAETLFRRGMNLCYGEHGVHEDLDKARGYFWEASSLDHAEAQYELALLLENEYGLDEQADEWLKRSADLGCGPALMALAEMDPDISQTRKNDLIRRARTWHEARAHAGDPCDQMRFARLLGRGDESLCWLRAAAEQDYVPACKELGRRLLSGNAGRKVVPDGVYWLRRAVSLGSHHACRVLGDLYLRGHLEPGPGYHVTRVPPDAKVAIAWYERGIALGGA